jgi:uncharacterized protein YqhQ
MPKTKEKAAPKTKKKSAPQKAEKKGPAKADETQEQEKREKHVEGIKKTVLSSLLGIAAGVVSSYLLPYMLFILIVAVYGQRLILPRLAIDTKEYRFTDWFFLVFMTVAFWFVSLSILLNKPA